MSDTLLLEKRGSVAYVTLHRPEVLNALNHESRQNLIVTVQKLQTDPDVRVVVLQGAGRAFCAGQDQKESSQFDHAGAARRIETYGQLFDTMRRLTKPVVAKIHGYAVGAGFQLALLADLRIASESAKVGLTELNVGSPCITGSALLWPIAGEAVVRRLVLTAEFVLAPEALRMGLVHEVVPEGELDAGVETLVAQLCAKPALAIQLSKEWWRLMTEDDFQLALQHAVQAHAENFEAGGVSQGSRHFLNR